MPYDYHDGNGYLAPGPTIPQWTAMRQLLTGSEGLVMANTGRTERPMDLADELPNDEPSLEALKRAAEQADRLLFISGGTQAAEE